MIVPRHWAEARLVERARGRQVTVRRFGWSDASEEDARRMAEGRAREALARILAGERLDRREPKVPYNGAEGVPIREEILAEHGDAVVTRNTYGAQCLNVPDVLFADVDFEEGLPDRIALGLALAAACAGVAAGLLGTPLLGAAAFVVVVVLGAPLVRALRAARVRAQGGPEGHALARARAFVAAHPAWHLRAYRTPAGLRLVADHATFDPRAPEVAAFFAAVGTDRQYVRMCARQRCFRARLTPKPWRIGIPGHLRPRPGVWPVRPERRAERAAWIAAYEEAARGHAACRHLCALGGGDPDPRVQRVVALHDELSRAHSGLPIA